LEVYGLIDPRSGELRYVGKTERSNVVRLKRHVHNAHEGVSSHAYNWLRQLLAAGLKPEVSVLEVHETAEALNEAERHLIAYFRSIGCDLTNATEGGDGSVGYRHTEESKQKQRSKMTGRRLTEEHRASISGGLMGRIVSHATRAKLSAANSKSNSYRAQSVVDDDGVVYPSISAAARALNIPSGNIARAVRNGSTAGGRAFALTDGNLAA
jgi:group I intron endonuclease